MGNNLVTRTEYKTYVGITNPNQDAEIDALIGKVSALVKTYCRQSFVDNYDDPKSEQTNGGDNIIYLKEHPVVSVLSVETSDDYGKTYTEMSEYSDWVYEPQSYGVRSINPNGFTSKINGYRVFYTCGYASVPEDLKLAVLDLITYYRKNDSAIHSPKAPGSNSVQIEYISTTSLPAHIRRILDLYVADYV